jgi:hypothetical protein
MRRKKGNAGQRRDKSDAIRRETASENDLLYTGGPTMPWLDASLRQASFNCACKCGA